MPFRPGSVTERVKAVAIATGDDDTAFNLGDDCRIYAMGRNHLGQIGDGTTTTRNTPVEVKIPRQSVLY
jgi:alpha-tubulin suppressor-like RCC1 family protein